MAKAPSKPPKLPPPTVRQCWGAFLKWVVGVPLVCVGGLGIIGGALWLAGGQELMWQTTHDMGTALFWIIGILLMYPFLIFMWVADDSAPPDRDLTRGKVEVVADKKAYAAGETAELLVLAPFAPAEGVLMLTRQGIVHFERFALTKTSQVLRTKLTTGHYPSVEARVVLVGEAPRDNAAGEPDPRVELVGAGGDVDPPAVVGAGLGDGGGEAFVVVVA